MNERDTGSTQQLSRRRFLALSGQGSAAALLATAAPAWAESTSTSPQPVSNPLASVSVTALAKAIRDKQICAEEVVDSYLKRIEAVNPKLNAIVQLTAQAARQQAKEADSALAKGELTGPLHGVPFTVKDNIETAGVVCTAGTFYPNQGCYSGHSPAGSRSNLAR